MSEKALFARDVRRQCQTILSRLAFDRPEMAQQLLADLCAQAHGIVEREGMQADLAAPERFDLANLHLSGRDDETPGGEKD